MVFLIKEVLPTYMFESCLESKAGRFYRLDDLLSQTLLQQSADLCRRSADLPQEVGCHNGGFDFLPGRADLLCHQSFYGHHIPFELGHLLRGLHDLLGVLHDLLYALQILLPGLNDELEGRLLGLVGRLRVLVGVDGCPCGPADRLLVLAGVDGCPCVPVGRLNGCADSWAASRDFWQQPPSLWC